MLFNLLPRAQVSARRILEVLNKKSDILDPAAPKEYACDGSIAFENVSVGYGGKPVLQHISFRVEKGQTLAIVGGTGVGKTTLLKLMLRFLDAEEGSVKVGGADVKDVEQKQLRASFGYAPQKSVLLSGTVRQNLAFADPTLSDDALLAAAKLACADGFLNEKSGLETEVAQGGKNFSGGQRRWLSIARAVAKKPKIALFDDSFSALDFATDARVRRNLKEQLLDVTKVIVAQRISTVRDADVIVVLDDGRAVGVRTHAELLKSCNVYPRLHRQNQSGAEGRHRRPDGRGQNDAYQSLDALLRVRGGHSHRRREHKGYDARECARTLLHGLAGCLGVRGHAQREYRLL